MNLPAELPDTPQLADLHEALLDAPTLDRLFDDIAAATELLEVTIKGGRLQRAGDAPVQLEAARALLASGAARGVQIRYRFEGAEWWDTLLTVSEGVRLVRIRHVWQET